MAAVEDNADSADWGMDQPSLCARLRQATEEPLGRPRWARATVWSAVEPGQDCALIGCASAGDVEHGYCNLGRRKVGRKAVLFGDHLEPLVADRACWSGVVQGSRP